MLENRSRWLIGIWQATRTRAPLFIFAIISVLVELSFFSYMVARGMLDKTVSLPIGGWLVPFSIAIALGLGNALLLLTLWMSLAAGTVYTGMSVSDREVRRMVYPLRLVRAAVVVLAPFVTILFLPYVIESGWYIGAASGLANSAPVLRGAIEGFYRWAYGLSTMDGSAKFVASQVAAGLGTVIVAGLYYWRVRGSRGLGFGSTRRRLAR